jgi:hypothetical protein
MLGLTVETIKPEYEAALGFSTLRGPNESFLLSLFHARLASV